LHKLGNNYLHLSTATYSLKLGKNYLFKSKLITYSEKVKCTPHNKDIHMVHQINVFNPKIHMKHSKYSAAQ